MVEIAISLAIIGIALVAIIGVLPLGHERAARQPRSHRHQPGRDHFHARPSATARAATDDLTNYVYAITNYQTCICRWQFHTA